MNSKLIIAPCCLLILASAPMQANASTHYTTRNAWLTALGSSVLIEDFESNVGSFAAIPTPFTTAKGFGLISVTGANVPDITMQILPVPEFTVLANGTQFLHFRDFANGLLVNFPGSAAAFGLDFGASEPGWTLTAAHGASYAFPSGPGSSGFIGFIDTLPFTSFTLTGPAGAQGGLSIDNISVPVPEPSTFYMMAVALVVGFGMARQRRSSGA